MQTKPLYVLVSGGGDGSYSTQYTFSTELINKLHKAYDDGLMDYESGIGCDGDGFHYKTLNVPVECTYESLGILWPLDEDYADQFNEE